MDSSDQKTVDVIEQSAIRDQEQFQKLVEFNASKEDQLSPISLDMVVEAPIQNIVEE